MVRACRIPRNSWRVSAEGERTAEEELVRRYTRGVSIILRRLAGTAAAADDLYQEVFLRAVEKIRAGEVRDPERLSGFICALARNLAIDHFRRRAPEKAPAEPEAGSRFPIRLQGRWRVCCIWRTQPSSVR